MVLTLQVQDTSTAISPQLSTQTRLLCLYSASSQTLVHKCGSQISAPPLTQPFCCFIQQPPSVSDAHNTLLEDISTQIPASKSLNALMLFRHLIHPSPPVTVNHASQCLKVRLSPVFGPKMVQLLLHSVTHSKLGLMLTFIKGYREQSSDCQRRREESNVLHWGKCPSIHSPYIGKTGPYGPTMSVCTNMMSKGVHYIAFSFMPDIGRPRTLQNSPDSIHKA